MRPSLILTTLFGALALATPTPQADLPDAHIQDLVTTVITNLNTLPNHAGGLLDKRQAQSPEWIQLFVEDVLSTLETLPQEAGGLVGRDEEKRQVEPVVGPVAALVAAIVVSVEQLPKHLLGLLA